MLNKERIYLRGISARQFMQQPLHKPCLEYSKEYDGIFGEIYHTDCITRHVLLDLNPASNFYYFNTWYAKSCFCFIWKSEEQYTITKYFSQWQKGNSWKLYYMPDVF